MEVRQGLQEEGQMQKGLNIFSMESDVERNDFGFMWGQ